MARKVNGEGSWTYLPATGMYQFRASFPEGRKSFNGKTKSECMRKFREYSEQHRELGIKKSTKKTVREFFHEYIENSYDLELSTKSTYLAYEATVDRHTPILDAKIITITPDRAEDYLLDMAGEVSYSTVKRIRQMLKSTFDYCISKGYITTNPFQGIRLHKRAYKPTRKRTMLTLDEIERVSNYILTEQKDHPLYLMLLFIIHTGLRAGELTGLQWSDIRGNAIYVRHNRVRVSKELIDNGYLLKSPKSESGCRQIPLSPTAQQILAFFESMKNRRSDYVFVEKDGSLPSAELLRYYVKKLIRQLDLPEISTHELRHSFGSALIAKGVDIGVVSTLMGHSDISITYNIYIHYSDNQLKNAISVLG